MTTSLVPSPAAAEPLSASRFPVGSKLPSPVEEQPQPSPVAAAAAAALAAAAAAAAPGASVRTTITTTTTTTASPEESPPATAAAVEAGAAPAAGTGVVIAAAPAENSYAKFYATPETAAAGKRERLTRSQHIARLACVLPLVAIGLAAMTVPLHGAFPRVVAVVDALNGGLLFIGLVCASVALSGARRAGRKGVLIPATAGTFFSGIFVGLVAGWATLGPRPAPAVAVGAPLAPPPVAADAPADAPAPTAKPVKANHPRPTPKLDVNDPSKTGRDTMARYAGWYGTATAKGAKISIGEFAAAKPVVEELRSMFDAHPNVLLIGIDNSHGRAPLAIDPSSIRAESSDGRRILALPVQTVLESAQVERERLMTMFNHLLEATPGQAAIYGFAFLPAETDLKAIDRVSLLLNGKRVVLSGQYLSAAQKTELSRRAEAQAMR